MAITSTTCTTDIVTHYTATTTTSTERYGPGVRALKGIKGPSQIDSRYLTEDVPIGMTIYAQLGRQVGLEPVLMESVIHLTRALLGTDFGDVPRTLARCGLDGLDRDGILFYVTTGRRPG